MLNLGSLLSGFGSARLGIDIGSSTIKIVAISDGHRGPKLLGATYEEMPNGVVEDGILNDPNSVTNVLRNAIDKLPIKSTKGLSANIGLKGPSVTFRRLLVPVQNDEDMKSQMILEAQNQIDTDLDPWIIDFQILSTADHHGQVPVMLVGAKRAVAEDYAKILSSLNLTPTVFDCDIFAIVNSYESANPPAPNETVICLDIGRDSSKFHLLQDGVPLIVRNFDTAGRPLTELILSALNVDMEQAEALKIAASSSESSEHPEVEKNIKIFLNNLSDEIRQTIDYFATTNTDFQIDGIDKIILSGGGANVRGLVSHLTSVFKTQVHFANPFAGMDVSSGVDPAALELPHIYTVAAGLALRRIGDRK